MNATEKMLVGLDEFPAGAIYRAAIGFACPLIVARWFDRGDWFLAPVLLVALFLLRLVPAVMRKLLPFPDAALTAWDERRQTAKRYDSYQWQKLLWVGVGIVLYMVLFGQRPLAWIVIAAVCLGGGMLGMARWRAVQRNRLEVAR